MSENLPPQHEHGRNSEPGVAGHLALGTSGVEAPAGLTATQKRLLAMTPASEIDSQIHGLYADRATQGARYWLERAQDRDATPAQRQEAASEYKAQMDAAANHAQLEQGSLDPSSVHVTQDQMHKVQRMKLG